MHASELNPDPDLTVPTIPAICDQCRAAGMAGDPAFAAIPEILNFTPVPRRAHANGWREEHQRAFIAALAITGSPKQAARAIGRHEFGAQQLRTARGGKSFAEAWDAAMELARERETHRIHANLAELARQRDAELSAISPSPLGGEAAAFRSSGGRAAALHGEGVRRGEVGAIHPDCDYDPDIHTDDYPEYWEAQQRIRERLLRARRLLLFLIRDDEDKRRAWEALVGPVDWDKAERMEPQPDEPVPDPHRNPHGMPRMKEPDMVLTVEAGLLPDLTGGHDALEEIREAVEAAQEAHPDEAAPPRASLPPRRRGSSLS